MARLRLVFALFFLGVHIAGGAEALRRADPAKPFSALLVGTLHYASGDYYFHTLNGTGPSFSRASRIFPGQRLSLLVLAGNYSVRADGQAEVVYDLDIVYPDGRVVTGGRDLSVVKAQVRNPALIGFARQTASFSTDPGDPPGNYTFVITARDLVAGTSDRQEQVVSVENYREPPLPADFDAERWMTGYYQNPRPEFAAPALARLAEIIAPDNSAAWPPVLGFYDALLGDNAWLTPFFLEQLARAGERERTVLLYVLGYAWRRAAPDVSRLPEDVAIQLEATRRHPWPDTDAPLLRPAQLDLLWGRFFATGAYAPIERLTEAFNYHARVGELEKLKAATPKPTQPTPEVMQELVLKAAHWSLRANARQHRLVRHYLSWLQAHNSFDPPVQALLAATLVPTAADDATPSAPTPPTP